MEHRVLTNEQMERIHEASLEILSRTGVLIPHEDMLKRLADRGAQVDFAEQRVRMPEELIEWAIKKATKTFMLYGRDLNKTAKFGLGSRNFNSSAGQALWLEKPGGKRRYPTLEDVAVATRIGDALSHINMPGPMADPHELSSAFRCVAVAAEMMRNTTKPITFWFYDRASTAYLLDLLVALRGSEEEAEKYPMFYPFFEPISPLRFPFDGIDLLYETARLNLPVPIGPMAQMGMSAPATIAGTLAQQNAEVLAGLVVTQCIREGMPVCYGGTCHSFDMATTQIIFSGPEQAIFGAAMTQMAKHYGFPVYVNVGLTDSKLPDAQAGMECGVTLQGAMAAGADIFGHMGICGADHAASLDMLILQNEVISFLENTMRTIEFSDETFGVDVIDETGPGGNFVSEPHTVEHFRDEMWFPSLLDRQYYESWLDAGAFSMAERCAARKDELLATHEVEPLPEEIDAELSRIVEAARLSAL